MSTTTLVIIYVISFFCNIALWVAYNKYIKCWSLDRDELILLFYISLIPIVSTLLACVHAFFLLVGLTIKAFDYYEEVQNDKNRFRNVSHNRTNEN